MSTKVPTPICTPKWVLDWWRTKNKEQRTIEQTNLLFEVRTYVQSKEHMMVVVEQTTGTVQKVHSPNKVPHIIMWWD